MNLQDQRQDTGRAPLREHVATSVRRYLRDLDGCGVSDLHAVVMREVEVPLFVDVPKNTFVHGQRTVVLQVFDGAKLISSIDVVLLGPEGTP